MINVFSRMQENRTQPYNDFVNPISGCYIIANRDIYTLNILLTIKIFYIRVIQLANNVWAC